MVSVSLVLLILPTRWTGGLISAVQLLVPLQDAAHMAAQSAAGVLSSGKPQTVPTEIHDEAQRKLAAREHQSALLTVRVEELERQVRVLTSTRLWDAGGSSIGSRGRLIPARVVTSDLLPWHSSRSIAAGSLQGVPREAAVVSNRFTIEQGESAGLREGLAILLGETLVGFVEQVGTHTSRVRLLSDPGVQMKVRIGRFEASRFNLAEGHFWLIGRCAGQMEIREIPRQAIEVGQIRVGDVVLSAATNEQIPVAMTIGKIAKVGQDRENPLFAQLLVESAVKERELDQVFVFDLNSDQ